MTEHTTKKKEHDEQSPSILSSFKEVVFFFLVALLIVIPIRIFIAQPYIVSGASMHPTFQGGDYLIVDQLSYRFNTPQRGDVVIFRFPLEPSKFFIKRIIGLPGETVILEDGIVTIEDGETGEQFVLPEIYIPKKEGRAFSRSLDDNEYFVLGDNRSRSLDSRAWGAVKRDEIIGRAFLRLFPFNEIDYLPGKASYFSNSEEDVTIEE